MAELIKTDRLTKRFGEILAVDGVSLSVEKGQVLGFLGPNGAGKSTTMKIVTGFLEPDAGLVRIGTFDMSVNPIEAKRHIGYLPEGAPAYADMTPRSFLRFIAEVRGFDGSAREARVATAADRTGLDGVMDQSIETLSKGYKRRVGLAQAILHDPDVLILDEPTDGLDPNQKYQVRALIAEMAPEKAIIVSTHILEEVEAVCSRAVVIDRGRIVADGTAEELQRRLPYHNAVSIRVSAETIDELKAALSMVEGVEKIEDIGRANGVVHIRAIAKQNGQIATEVAAAIRAKSLSVDEMFVERGRLDDVFRQITTSDTAKGFGANGGRQTPVGGGHA
jgi:gliding motility-associated transport system ATP-binding protein